MAASKRILIVIDPTAETQPALERIARLPRPLDAELMLVICTTEAKPRTNGAFPAETAAAARAATMARHERTLAALAAPLREQGLQVHFSVRWEAPLHEAIIREAVEWSATLVVKDTHYHSILKRSIFSNTDWNLIRHCPMPLLLVKPRATSHVPCVVAAVDPLHPRDERNALDDRIVTAAVDLASLVAGRAHLLHVCETVPMVLATPEALMAPIALPMPEIAAEMEQRHTAAVHALADAHGIPRERAYLRKGGSRDVLIEATAELGADFLVMGAVSRSALERAFLGSTAEAVLDRLSCDVVVVKPEGFPI